MTTTKDERTKAIQHYFAELLKDPDVIWESISEVACSSDEEAAKRVADIANSIESFAKMAASINTNNAHWLTLSLAGLITAAYDYITDLATARYDAEGAP